jgi:ABC-type antimicrobial peptide transport system permease subunit
LIISYHGICRKKFIRTSGSITKQTGVIIHAGICTTKQQCHEKVVNDKIKNVVLNHFTDENTLKSIKPEVFIHPMSKWRLYSDFENGKNTGGFIKYVRMFGILGIIVLLIACINFMNLSTARSEKRAKEVGVRKALVQEEESSFVNF